MLQVTQMYLGPSPSSFFQVSYLKDRDAVAAGSTGSMITVSSTNVTPKLN